MAKGTNILVLLAVTIALSSMAYAGAPLPLHNIEGNSGVYLTTTAYLVNPPAEGEVLGLPSFSISTVFIDQKDLQAYCLTENILGRIEVGFGAQRLGLGDWSDDVFQATALEPWQISTLFQLLAMRRDKSPLLEMAETMLMTPDLVHYFLTGVKACERSIVQTGNLIGTDCQWCWDVIDRFQLPRRIFPKLIGPAEVVGPLQPAVRDDVGLGDVPVIASCGHDTSAAVAAVPGEGNGWAFLSCGTWSILGTVLDTPVTDLACLRAGFTNEYSVGGWFLAKNILGLWLVQQLRAKWDKSGDPWDYPRMTAQAEAAPPGPIVHAVDDSLLAPPDMESALLALLSKTGQSAPESRGQLVRCVLESLALEYSTALDAIGELTGRRPQSVYMVGGGTANKLLCQLTADACGVGVRAGVDQCTAIGNALGQAIALGIIQDVGQARQVVRNSFELASYEPQDASIWQEKRARYRTLSG